MKISNSLDTTSPLMGSIRKFFTLLALIYPFMPNAYRTVFLLLGLLGLLITEPLALFKKETIPIYIFLLVAILTSLFSFAPLKALINTKGILFDILVPFVIFAYSPLLDKKLFQKILPYTVLLFTFITLMIYWLYPRGFPFFNREHWLVGFLGGKLTYAGAISFLLPILYFRDDKKYDPIVLLSIIFLLLNVTINMSRSYYLANALFLLSALSLKKYRFYYLFSLLFFIASIFLYRKGVNYLKQSFPAETNLSSYARIEMWKLGLRVTKERPLVGIGYELWPLKADEYIEKYKNEKLDIVIERPTGKKAIHGHLHSNYIMALVNGGFLLFLSFLFFIAFYLYHFAKNPMPYKILGIGLILMLAVSGLFEYNFSDAEVIQNFSLALGILIGLKDENSR